MLCKLNMNFKKLNCVLHNILINYPNSLLPNLIKHVNLNKQFSIK